jgi:hypothetical protein
LERQNRRLAELLKKYTPEHEFQHYAISPPGSAGDPHTSGHISQPQTADETLETMINATGVLQIDGMGKSTYRGHCAGLTVLERIQSCCTELLPAYSLDNTQHAALNITHAFDFPKVNQRNVRKYDEVTSLLPPRVAALRLVTVCLTDACSLMSFVHAPTFHQAVERIYAMRESQEPEEDLTFLPLLFSALALGKVFTSEGCSSDNNENSQWYDITALKIGRSLTHLPTTGTFKLRRV